MRTRKYLGQPFQVAAIALGTLLFESTLTRLLAVAQFYHFAFLVVSLALLGFGASGTLLSIAPGLKRIRLDRLLSWSGVGFALGVGLAYLVVNWLPFDSYSIAWERRQILYFLLYYLALTIPFFISASLCFGIVACGDPEEPPPQPKDAGFADATVADSGEISISRVSPSAPGPLFRQSMLPSWR